MRNDGEEDPSAMTGRRPVLAVLGEWGSIKLNPKFTALIVKKLH